MDFLLSQYSLIKALHVIFVIYWMAGLLMLPRFLVYHYPTTVGSAEDQAWQEREARLNKIILRPAFLLSFLFGLMMMVAASHYQAGWFHGKATALIGMIVFQLHMTGMMKRFKAGERPKSEKYFRLMNEIPSLLIIVIVLLVVLKPF